MGEKREMLRHAVATVVYRCAKTLRDGDDDFGSFQAADGTRTPVQILAHIGDLFDWAHSIAVGAETWRNAEPMVWSAEVERFFAGVQAFDDLLATRQDLAASEERLFQGPVADALTHVGQIAMLRRMYGSPIRGENYFVADIKTGRAGADQSDAKREFD